MGETAVLKPKLSRLKLSGILEHLDLRLEQAIKGKWSYTEFLLNLFQDEIERRDYHMLALRLKKSNLDPKKRLDNFDFNINPSLNERCIREIALCDFIEKKENILFLGPTGVGKTHLSHAIGHEAIRKDYDVYTERVTVILGVLNAGRADGSYMRRLQNLCKIHLLILDDFGLNDLTKTQQDDLYELIYGRYENTSTIITSNRNMNEWFSLFNNQLLASAAMDRLVHRAKKITIEGDSYRVMQYNAKNN